QLKSLDPAAPPVIAPAETLGVIGAGVMGRTLLQGLLESGAVSKAQMWASAKTQSTCDNVAAELEIPVEKNYAARVAKAGLILICVKPSQAGKVIQDLKAAGLREETLLISIMAGM